MNFFRLLRFYLKYATKNKLLYFIFLCLIFLEALVWNFVPFLISEFISIAQTGNISLLNKKLIQITVFNFVSIILFEFLSFNLAAKIFSKMIAEVKNDVFFFLQKQDYSFHISKSTGKLVSKINKVDSGLSAYLYNLNLFLLSLVIGLIIPLVIITMYSVKIAIIIIILLLIYFPLFVFLLKYNFKMRAKINQVDNEITDVLVDNLSGFEIVKSFGKEKSERDRFSYYTKKLSEISYKTDFSYRYLFGSNKIIGLIITFVGISVAIILFRNSTIELKALVVLVSYLTQFPWKILELTFQIREIIKGSADLTNFLEIYKNKPQILEQQNPKIIKTPRGSIRFENVSFKYSKNKTLNKISFKISPNERVAFVGPSGSGKTTIVKLILRYYDPNYGAIFIDDVNIKDIQTKCLRSIIGLVPQDPIMFNNSIFFNVGYAKENATLDEVRNACKLAQIDNFVMSLPKKYDTIVGERGIKLSGGQKQRLAIARIILKNPKILIFDEATSQLDSESEKLIQKAVFNISKDKTTIIIAHRLSTIINCNKIFVVNEGKIVQTGNHAELSKTKGLYKELWDIQSKGFVF